MLLKLLLVIGIIAAVYFLFIKKRPAVSGTDTKPRKNDDDTLVPCEACGVFVTTKEAFIKAGKFYCSKACMEGE